jgi:hypothetical protein
MGDEGAVQVVCVPVMLQHQRGVAASAPILVPRAQPTTSDNTPGPALCSPSCKRVPTRQPSNAPPQTWEPGQMRGHWAATYWDDDFRVFTTNKGSLFIMTKQG